MWATQIGLGFVWFGFPPFGVWGGVHKRGPGMNGERVWSECIVWNYSIVYKNIMLTKVLMLWEKEWI